MDTYDILEIYNKACEMVDTNTKNQVTLDIPRFVLFYNAAQNQFIRSILQTLRSSDQVEIAQRFLQPVPMELNEDESGDNYFKYDFPEDFIKHEKVLASAIKEGCGETGYTMRLEEVKPTDVDLWLTDTTREPSFEYREGFYYVGKDGVFLYTDSSFSYSDVTLIYYRLPVQIDIEGYINEQDEESTTIQTEWSRTEVETILSLMVENYTRAQLPIKQE